MQRESINSLSSHAACLRKRIRVESVEVYVILMARIFLSCLSEYFAVVLKTDQHAPIRFWSRVQFVNHKTPKCLASSKVEANCVFLIVFDITAAIISTSISISSNETTTNMKSTFRTNFTRPDERHPARLNTDLKYRFIN